VKEGNHPTQYAAGDLIPGMKDRVRTPLNHRLPDKEKVGLEEIKVLTIRA
jgi:hypothetical protein